MTRNKKIILTLILATILFCASFFYVKNDICCMFASTMHRGFPYQILLITKGTDDFQEAQKVYHLNDLELLKQGWELKAGPVFGPPWSIPFNLLFYFAISWGIIFILERMKRIYDQK